MTIYDPTVLRDRIYGNGPEHSYFQDLFAQAQIGHPEHHAANDRLLRYGQGLDYLMRNSEHSPEGRRARRIVNETRRQRTGAGESRAMTSSSGSAGSFVTPSYLLEDAALYRSYAASFLSQCNRQPLPDFGLEVYLPAWEGPASVAVQGAEGAVVANASPTGAYLSTGLSTVVGEIDVSQQLFDRIGGGYSADALIAAQLQEQLDAAVDSYLLTAALAGAGTVVQTATSYATSQLVGDLGKAAAQAETAPGVAAPSLTHVFLTPNLYEFCAAQVDSTGRPIFVPVPDGAYLPIVPGPTVPGSRRTAPAGYTGEKILSRAVFIDGNIAPVGSGTQIITADMREVYAFVGDPVVAAVPETLAGSLDVVIQLRCYVGAIVRYPKAVQVISSTTGAYPAAPTFS